MTDWMQNPAFWLVLGGVVIAVLAGVAGYYLLALRRQTQRQSLQLAELRKAGEEQRKRINNSIQVLAQATLTDQVSLTEGAIRIRVLLDSLSVETSVRDEFKAFYLLAQATDHIPILEQWKSLSTKKKLEFDRQREKLEVDHKEFVQDAAKRILGRAF